ncbi:MAG: DUF4062 domain-containing protein [Pseudomonadota bacterium]|nr:DUF4062 domain-containing protein [Pseudomonadota bacterium]
MGQGRKLILYISSTFRDLKDHRAALKIALEKAGYDVDCMERYPAFDERPLDRCLQDVALCDGYVLILAHRYGSRPDCPDGRLLSITEREYEEATLRSRTRLAFCVDDSYTWPGEQDAPGSADAESLDLFRSRVKRDLGVDFFKSPDNLSALVLAALSAHNFRAALSPFPTADDLERVRRMASGLLEDATHRSKMPAFVAPLRLAVLAKEGDDSGPDEITVSDLIQGLAENESFQLVGDGGIGKTTLMLGIASACIDSKSPRIPLYIDAPVWARSRRTIPDYIASTVSAQRLSVTATEIAQLAEIGQLALLVNGWNEIAADLRLNSLDAIGPLTTGATAVPTLVSSRSLHDSPSLPKARSIEVQGLRWPAQRAIIQAELAAGSADSLLRILSTDNALRLAARNPLILRGLIAQSRQGETIGPIFDILGAIVREFEADPQRAAALRASPMYDRHRDYLADLAAQLTDSTTTALTRDEALAVLRGTAIRLEETRVLAPGISPADVLAALCGQHLLQSTGDLVRFAHQRFQEYFAASPLLGDLISPASPDSPGLERALNAPAWDDAVDLVAEKLSSPATKPLARVRLVVAALRLDLGRACDLAARCALTPTDDASLWARMIAAVNGLAASPDPHIARLATRYQLLSRFREFAEPIWPLLESDSQQVRLSTHRLVQPGLSLKQLGPEAAARIATWPSDRRAELMHEIASDVENYEIIRGLAFHEPDPKVRTAAIHALFWNYPASRDPVVAWLAAPREVQADGQLLQWIEEAMEDATQGADVREALQALADTELPENVHLRLIGLLPDGAASHSVDAILEYLQSTDAPRVDARLIEIVSSVAPQRLQEVACRRALQATYVPEWVTEVLRNVSSDRVSEAFERSWSALESDSGAVPNAAALATFANRSQVARVVAKYLESLRRLPGATESTAALDQEMWLRRVLSHVNGDDLLEAVATLGADASYEESGELLRLLSTRMALDGDRSDGAGQWAPTAEAMTRLITMFSEKVESAPICQDAVFVHLSAMACAMECPDAPALLVDAFRRQLDCWAQYEAAIQIWRTKPDPHSRPTNPHMGNPLQGAAFRGGPSIVPGLVALLDHPQAAHTVPGAIVRALCAPWEGGGTDLHRTVADDIVEGERRRQGGCAFLQSTAQYQATTDHAAGVLAHKLDAILDEITAQKAADLQFNDRQAAYRVRSLVTLLARIPSQAIVPSVVRALSSGFSDEYAMLDALRALVRQGLQLSDPNSVAALEAQIERSTSGWRSHNDNYVVAWLCQLTFCVVPPATLARPLEHYTSVWQKYSYSGDLARGLARIPTEIAWGTLLGITRESVAKGQPSEELLLSLGSMLTRDRLAPFFELLKSDGLRSWRPHVTMGLDSVANRVAAAVKGDVTGQRRLAQLCIDTASFASDALGLAALADEEFDNGAFLELANAAMDAGRLAQQNSPTYHIILELFTRGNTFERDGQRYHSPTAHRELRQAIYDRAAGDCASADACRRLLADIESARIELGRPTNEMRHPRPSLRRPWTDVLWHVR